MRCVACAVSWAILLPFTGVPAWCVVSPVRCPGPLALCAPVCPLDALSRVCGVLGHFAPVHRCARSMRCLVSAVSWATWLLLTGVFARWVVLRVRCPGPLGSCSPAWPLGRLCRVCAVLGHLPRVHQCTRSMRCLACAVSWGTWLLFTCVLAPCVVLCVRCPGSLGSCSHVCLLGWLCCVCGVLGHLLPVHWCVCSVGCVACAVSWATRLLFTDVAVWCVVSRVRCPGPLASCAPVYPLDALSRVCSVLGHLALVHLCARSVCCVVRAVSWATWLLLTGVFARWVTSRVRCPGPLASRAPLCSLRALCCVCGVLGHLALLLGASPRYPWGARGGPLGSCSPVWSLGALCCVCGVLGHLAPVHRCACLV